MPTSESSIRSFWTPVFLLLRVRRQVARHRFTQNPTAFLWTILLACALGLAAFSRGGGLGAAWETASADQGQILLERMWLLMEALWLTALLIPGGLNLFGQAPPRATLRAFALRPVQIMASEVMAAVIDLPTLPALLLTLPLTGHMLLHGHGVQAGVTLIVFVLLGLQTSVLARLLTYLGAWMLRRARRWAERPVLKLLLLIGFCVGMPPAFASLTSTPSPSMSLPTLPHVSFEALSPVTMATRAVVSTRRTDYFGASEALGQLGLCLCLTGYGTLRAFRSMERPLRERQHKVSRPSTGRATSTRQARAQSPQAQVWAVAQTEWRLLLRAPQNYLPLRKPASLLLLSVFAFLSPDMGRNPVYNLKEFLGIGAILYSILWQVQLLCNRFGNDAGTGALLFGFSVPRRRLLLGRNLALFALLLLIDSGEIVGLTFVAESSDRIPLFLAWLPLILLVLTTLGNVVSVLEPFPIAPQDRQAGREPPDGLAAAYPGILGATALLLWPVAGLLSWGTIGILGSAVYLGVLYVFSLYVASHLLTQRETTLIARLDRNGL